jgi:hypothetical protein
MGKKELLKAKTNKDVWKRCKAALKDKVEKHP